MKLLLWHCDYLSYRDVKQSTRPLGIDASLKTPTAMEFTDVLAVFVCVEAGDGTEMKESAVDLVVKALRRIGEAKQVVVVPFAHLSNKLALPSVAEDMIREIYDALISRGASVCLSSFGYHKTFSLSFHGKGYPGSVAFRDPAVHE